MLIGTGCNELVLKLKMFSLYVLLKRELGQVSFKKLFCEGCQ